MELASQWAHHHHRQQMCELLRNKGIVCKTFFDGEPCPRGATCPYMHLRNGETRPVPWSVCAFFANGTCLRDRCTFFHGTKEQLDGLHKSGAKEYRPQDYMRMCVPPSDIVPINNRIVPPLLPQIAAPTPAPYPMMDTMPLQQIFFVSPGVHQMPDPRPVNSSVFYPVHSAPMGSTATVAPTPYPAPMPHPSMTFMTAPPNQLLFSLN